MLIKMKVGAGWRWIDGIDDVQDFGPLLDPCQDSSAESAYFAQVRTFSDARDAVAHLWGPEEAREFDAEIWPFGLPGGDTPEPQCSTNLVPINLNTVKARRGKDEILIVLADEAFLLSDTGSTIDRLR